MNLGTIKAVVDSGLADRVRDWTSQESRCASTSFRHSRVRVEELGIRRGRPWHRLLEPLKLTWAIDGQTWHMTIPAGFESDYASTPRWLWAIVPPDGPWMPAAIGHDFLYQRGRLSRFLADAIFRDAMAGLGVPIRYRVLIFYAVRLFGGRYFRGARK